MKNKKNIFIFPLIVTIIKMIFIIPAHITGGFAGVDEFGYCTLLHIVASKTGGIIDGFWYTVLTHRYILEGFIVFAISMLIAIIIYKIIPKKKG